MKNIYSIANFPKYMSNLFESIAPIIPLYPIMPFQITAPKIGINRTHLTVATSVANTKFSFMKDRLIWKKIVRANSIFAFVEILCLRAVEWVDLLWSTPSNDPVPSMSREDKGDV